MRAVKCTNRTYPPAMPVCMALPSFSSLLWLWLSGFSVSAAASGAWLLASPTQEERALAVVGASMGALLAGLLLQAVLAAVG